MNKLISIDLYADFGMLKKPDTNEPVYLTFNMIHKPAFLGILGAIIGLEGFHEKGKLPEYYEKLKDLKIGIQPLLHENGNFQKSTVKYNNATGLANKDADNKNGATLNVIEQFLIAPAFRCFILLDMNNELYQKINNNLKNNYAEYLPYLGKNEFSLWWENYKMYEFDYFKPQGTFKIKTIYIKDQPLKDSKDNEALLNFDPVLDDKLEGFTFSYFERLPVEYQDIENNIFQYRYENFAFTDWNLKLKNSISNTLLKINDYGVVQVF